MKKILLFFIVVLSISGIFYYKKKCKNCDVEKDVEVAQQIKEKAKKVFEKEDENKKLEGKTIAFIGDSLIEGYGNDFHGFDYYLSQNLPNTNFINNSKSGSTITDNSGEDNIVIINQVRTLEGNPDVIILDGGANDIIGYGLGFLNNDLKKEIYLDENQDSVILDFEEILQELKNKFPNTKLCYFNPFLIDDETISHLTQDEEIANDIKQRRIDFLVYVEKLCEKYNIEYLDVSNLIVGTEEQYRQSDYIHLNEKGYKLLTPLLLKKLNELFQEETDEQTFNALVIGNSITLERDGIGMAATDEFHDYYYLLKTYLKEKYKKVKINRISAIHWEENRIITSREDWINENLTEDVVANKDLVVFQLGDNCVPTETFEEDLTKMINHVRQYSPNAQMILVGMWFINEERLNLMPQIAEKLGLTFVNISDLVVDEYKSEIGTEIIGIDGKKDRINTIEEAFHPNNKGMQKIAERIIENIK